MRISDLMLQNNFLSSLNSTKARMEKLQTQVASNNKLNAPSDSPTGVAKVMRFENSISQANNFIGNIQNSLAFVNESISGLDFIQNEATKILVNLTQVKNAVNNENLDTFADQIDSSLNIILEAANKEFNDQYLFAGTDDSTMPYGYTADLSAIELKVSDVSGERNVKISKNITQKINITGSELFGSIDGTDIFNKLIEIRDNLRSGVRPSDADVKVVEDFSKNVLNKLSDMGNISNKLYDVEEVIKNQILTLENLVAKEKEVDVAAAVMELQNQDYILQLSYKMSSMILPRSLLDYL